MHLLMHGLPVFGCVFGRDRRVGWLGDSGGSRWAHDDQGHTNTIGK